MEDLERPESQKVGDLQSDAGPRAEGFQSGLTPCKAEHEKNEHHERKDSGVSLAKLLSDTNGTSGELKTKITDSTPEPPPATVPTVAANGVFAGSEQVTAASTGNATGVAQTCKVSRISALIFDIGDVLCNWTAPDSLPIAPEMLHRFRKTRFWYDWDLGLITEDECYDRLSQQYNVPKSDISEAFDKARDSLVPNDAVFDIIRALKSRYKETVKFYLMSNIPKSEWAALRKNPNFDWSLFDSFFTSSGVRMCKPELRFYRHVLRVIRRGSAEVVLVDDNAENVLAARSLGIKSLRFREPEGLNQFMENAFHDPIERGIKYLKHNAKQMWSVTPQGREVRDNFAQLFLYEAMGDIDLVTMTFYERTWNYFIEKPIDTVEELPDDVDTTALAMILLCDDVKKANDIMDEILKYTNADGIIMTYFDNKRPRVDPAVCVNALRFFYKFSQGELPALQPSKDWISDILFYRAYVDGTYYYPSGDVFLYLFSRLLAGNPESDMYRRTASLLRERLQERVGSSGDALELAMRVIACLEMGIKDDVDLKKLETSQQQDGGWPVGWLCQTGKKSIKIGNRGLTTALAVKAIEMGRKTRVLVEEQTNLSRLSRAASEPANQSRCFHSLYRCLE